MTSIVFRAAARRLRASVRQRRANRADQAPSFALVQGFSLELPTHFRYHYVDRDYEPLSRRFLIEHVAIGGRVVDVGAHIGLYTLLLARAVGPSGQVTSVEPAAENLRYLRANIEANAFSDRVKVLEAAATDTTGTVSFHLTGSSDSHGLHAHPNTLTRRIVTVPSIRLDEVVGPVDFVKIDTEGAELGTLAGLRGSLTAPGPRAALVEWAPECQSNAGHDITELPRVLQEMGFSVSVLDDQAGVERSVDDVIDGLRTGRLDKTWYGNLACVRSA